MTNMDNLYPKIAIIGAGSSGICAGIRLKTQLKLENFKIYDENNDFGGVWLVNEYPGCQSNLQIHLYCFSFEETPNWPNSHGTQPEIRDYLQGLAKKHKLKENARFNTHVDSYIWLEESKQWKLTIFDKIHKTSKFETFDFVICSKGPYSVPNIPKELCNFSGPKFHSAQWDPKFNLLNKRVGVFGSGASAIQIIPSIAGQVKELHCFQRQPYWVLPKGEFKVPQFVKTLFAYLPFLMIILRIIIFITYECGFQALRSGSIANKISKWLCQFHLTWRVKDKKMRSRLTPDYELGYKEILLSDTYLQTFNRKNVKLHLGEIQKAFGKDITTSDGENVKLDVLIFATGFTENGFKSGGQILGVDNFEFRGHVKSGESYYGMMYPKMPNFFVLLGPNTAVFNSTIFMIECQVNFIIQVLRKCLKDKIPQVRVKSAEMDRFMEGLDKAMDKMAYSSSADELPNNNNNNNSENPRKVKIMWPKQLFSYFWETHRININKELEFLK